MRHVALTEVDREFKFQKSDIIIGSSFVTTNEELRMFLPLRPLSFCYYSDSLGVITKVMFSYCSKNENLFSEEKLSHQVQL